MGFLKDIAGLLRPSIRFSEPAPPTSSGPGVIPGGHVARELCMLPKDASLPTPGELDIVRLFGRDTRRVVQLKADGIRGVMIDGRIYTREGSPLNCARHCQPGIDRMIARATAAGMTSLFSGGIVLDGEYAALGGFNDTLTEFKRGEGDGVFWIFDAIPFDHWARGRCDIPIEVRLCELRKMILKHSDSEFVGMLDFWELTPEETIGKAQAIWAMGGEGVVSKAAGSPYFRGRSDLWLRVKQTFTVDGRIVDIGTVGSGKLKKAIVRIDASRAGDAPQTVVVSTGWNAQAEKEIVRLVNAMEQPWVEISFQMTTGAKRSVRGARFVRLRGPK